MAAPGPIPAGDPHAPRDGPWVDEALAPFAVFVEALSIASTATISGSENVPSVWVEKLEIEMPFEMDVMFDSGDHVRLSGGPPTQYTETTIMPIFHRVRLSVAGAANL